MPARSPDSPINFNGRAEGSNLDAYQALYTRAAGRIREAGGFGEPELWRYDWERSYARDELSDLAPAPSVLGLAW